MPGVFSAINTRLQGNLIGKDLRYLSAKLPEGKVVTQEGWVQSKVIPGTNLYIKGKYDLLVDLPNGTQMLVDLKISQPHEDKIDKYQTQLTAYKFALENPVYGKAAKITRMGLLVFYPDEVSITEDSVLLHFPPKWLEVPIDDAGFLTFTKEVDKLLAGPPPQEGKECKWCKYRHLGDTWAHEGEAQQELPF